MGSMMLKMQKFERSAQLGTNLRRIVKCKVAKLEPQLEENCANLEGGNSVENQPDLARDLEALEE